MGGLRKTRGRAAILPTNLLALQNLLKRDPPSYKVEFIQQLNHYQTSLQIFQQNPSNKSASFAELISFIAQVSSCFPEDTATFPEDLANLLAKHHNVLDLDLREKIVQNLVLLRNKGVISSTSLLTTLFPVLAMTNSKALRAQIYESIVSTIKNENLKSKNATLNKMVQAMLFDMVQKDEVSGVWAIRLTKELWTKNIWAGDARVAEICKTAALSEHTKVMLGGIYFFLGDDANDMEDPDQDDGGNEVDLRRMQHQAGINKLSKNRAQRVKKAVVADKKRRVTKKTQSLLNFSALQLLHDPQSFAEKLFSVHLASKKPMPFEHKLKVIALLGRLVGTHKLTLLSFYSFLQKWVSPHQRDVTNILASLAGACHEFVPPEILSPCVKKIANEFVTTGVSPEVVCAGLNAIREICARNPLCMDATLLQDLTEYKGSKDKGVMMASRSLITLYRTTAPEMLNRKDRGKAASMGVAAGTHDSAQFGVERGVTRGIEGLELLEAEYAREAAERGLNPEEAAAALLEEQAEEDANAGWEGFEIEDSDGSDDGGEGWINVESDGEDLEFSDSEDDDEDVKKRQKEIAGKKVTFEDNPAESAAAAVADSDQAAESVPEVAAERDLKSIATTRILTPADFKRLSELKAQGPLAGTTKKTTHHTASAKRAGEARDFVDPLDIEGPRKKAKQDLEARLASVAEGRKDREKFGSKKGNRSEEGRSTTNREKARKKNFLMVKHRKDIQGKSMKKLTIKRKELQAHISRGKRGGKRGNK